MTPKHSFMTPLDYTFYLLRLLEREKQINYGGFLNDAKKNQLSPIELCIETPTLSELIQKLAEDLKSSPGSFVDTFIDEPHNGLSWLLDLLRSTLNRQNFPEMFISDFPESYSKNRVSKNKERHTQLKRAMIDEYDCLLCLKNAANRKPVSVKSFLFYFQNLNLHHTLSERDFLSYYLRMKSLYKILDHRNGLTTLASCIISNLTKSRIIALELLTKACNVEPEGGKKVLEAMSAMRLIFGESVRFKLLISIINSTSSLTSNGLELTAMTFLNTLLQKSANQAERVRLQCEMEEAGLDVNSLEKKVKEKGLQNDNPLWLEIKQWRDNYINIVDILQSKHLLSEELSKVLEKNETFQKVITKLESDKLSLKKIEKELKEKCDNLEAELITLKARLNEDKIKSSSKRQNETNGRPGSDNSDPFSANADSGQWSDSEGGELNRFAQSRNLSSKMIHKNLQCQKLRESDDQSMRNEDIFIYIPSIRPPANFFAFLENDSKSMDNLDKTKVQSNSKKLQNDNFFKQMSNNDIKWKPKQEISLSANNEQAVVDACFKPNEIKDEIKIKKKKNLFSLPILEGDYENVELTLNWDYPNFDSQTKKFQSDKTTFFQSSEHLDNFFENVDFEKHLKSPEASEQFFFKSRDSSPSSLTESVKVTRLENFSTCRDTSPIPLQSQCKPISFKPKTFAASLQSYFFGGSQKPKYRPSDETFFDNVDSHKSFPLPNAYKKNFIAKGHGNCGLYSGNEIESSFRKEDLSLNMSNLVHREIALAVKELGAWF